MPPVKMRLGSDSWLQVGGFASILSFFTTSEPSLPMCVTSNEYPVCHASELLVVSGTGRPKRSNIVQLTPKSAVPSAFALPPDFPPLIPLARPCSPKQADEIVLRILSKGFAIGSSFFLHIFRCRPAGGSTILIVISSSLSTLRTTTQSVSGEHMAAVAPLPSVAAIPPFVE